MSWLLMLAAVDNRPVLLLCQLGKGLNGHTVCVKFGLNVSFFVRYAEDLYAAVVKWSSREIIFFAFL